MTCVILGAKLFTLQFIFIVLFSDRDSWTMIFEKEANSMRKQVVIYSEAFLPNIGGGENYCADLARTLTDLGEDVTVITPIKSATEDTFNFNLIRMRAPIFIGFNINFLEPFIHIVKERPKVVILSGPAVSDFAMIPFLSLLLQQLTLELGLYRYLRSS